MSDEILIEEIECQDGYIGVLTLNRQTKLNALNLSMFQTLTMQLKAWHESPNIHAVLIQAAPGKAFSAGGDLREVYNLKLDSPKQLESYFATEYRLNHLIFHYRKPYIAWLDGITMGGGVGISLHGSHPIGTENLVFAMPESKIGFFPDIGASYFLSHIAKPYAHYLGLMGESININKLLELGLIKHAIRQERKAEFIEKLKKLKLAYNSHAKITSLCVELSHEEFTPEPIPHHSVIETCFNKNFAHEIIAALQHEGSPFAKECANALKQKSPTSLKVIMEQLRKGKALEFDECLKMEFVMTMNFCMNHDFFEGIRAMIIDKDKKPRWNPAKLEDIHVKDVEAYFKL